MNPLTLEWIEKAEGDFITAQRKLKARRSPNFDASCFHSQQMAEKYLKAYLQEKSMPVPRTHNLIDLLTLSASKEDSLFMLRSDMVLLDRYAVRFRYPGEIANKHEAKAAWQSAKAVSQFIRNRLGFNK